MFNASRGSWRALAVAGAAGLCFAAGNAMGQCVGYNMTTGTGTIDPGTTDIGNHYDDAPETTITLPFAWTFYGTSYTSVQVDSNGQMTFGTAGGSTAYTNACLPTTTFTAPTMMPYWDDLRTDNPSAIAAITPGVYTSTTGTAPNRVFNIEWRAVFYATTTSYLDMEVRLHENSSQFDYVYGASTSGGSGGTIGCQPANATAQNSTQYICNQSSYSFPAAGTVLTFVAQNSSTVLCSTGSSSPAGVNNCNGANTLLTVSVTPGVNPASTGIAVSADLTNIGGSAAQPFYDDGTHGDVTAGDNIFSYQANVPSSVAPGAKVMNYTCADQQGRSGSGSMSVTVNCVTPPNPTLGPDVVTWNITDVPRWGTDSTGTITAYSVGTTSSNEGDYPVNWLQATIGTDYNPTQHPVISQNMYRLKVYGTAPNTYSRFEQLGQSWLKHGFTSTNSPGGGGPNPCSLGAGGALGDNLWRYSTQSWQNGVGGQVLSVGCTDTYGGSLNGSQSNLGPKNLVNATTGYSDFVQGTSTGDATVKGRLQVPTADVTGQPAGTHFYADAWYVTQDDSQFVHPGQTVASNGLNNASWVELTASTINGSPTIASFHRHDPGILAWLAADPTITLVTVDDDTTPNPGIGYKHADGTAFTGTFIRARFWVAVKAVNIGGGMTRYEYAVYNHNHDRSGQSFTVPLPATAALSDISFHAPQWHSGEPYANTPWTASRSGDSLVFSTQTYAANPNANALRWGELFNFGFTTDAAPTTGNATIALFKPAVAGEPAALTVGSVPVPTVPPHCGTADFNQDGDTATDADIEAFFACLGGNCCNTCQSVDFNGDGDSGTDADIEAFFRVLAGGTC